VTEDVLTLPFDISSFRAKSVDVNVRFDQI